MEGTERSRGAQWLATGKGRASYREKFSSGRWAPQGGVVGSTSQPCKSTATGGLLGGLRWQGGGNHTWPQGDLQFNLSRWGSAKCKRQESTLGSLSCCDSGILTCPLLPAPAENHTPRRGPLALLRAQGREGSPSLQRMGLRECGENPGAPAGRGAETLGGQVGRGQGGDGG